MAHSLGPRSTLGGESTPRTASTDPAMQLIAVACLTSLAAPPAAQEGDFAVSPRPGKPRPRLAYVAASNGLGSPGWEGGGTELEFGDVNGDGAPDLLSIGDHGSPFVNSQEHGIMSYFGNGGGSWLVSQNGNFGYGGIAVGDVNGDGYLDVAYGMHHNYSANDFGDQLLEVALGDGSGTNWLPWDDGLATNGETWGMFATDLADVDNDGLLDVGSNSFGCCAGVHVYRNVGDGTWTQTFGFLGGNADSFFTFGDVNADGNADFAAANDMGSVWLGDGGGGFTNVDGNLPGTGILARNGLDLGDVDNDGTEEFAFVLPNGQLEVWSHQGGSSWARVGTGLPDSSVIRMLQVVDLDADGRKDLLGIGGGYYGAWKGGGAGGFRRVLIGTIREGATAEALRSGTDFDHNGRPDFALLQDEPCGLFCSQNKLYAYREGAPATVLSAFLAEPRGGGVWKEGSVRRVEWFSSVPGESPGQATIQLSTTGPGGPWTTLSGPGPNDGSEDLLVPEDTATTDAYVRVVVSLGGKTAGGRSPRPFTIVP